jgi:diguanylate cyclase (GGDEF)-like protein
MKELNLEELVKTMINDHRDLFSAKDHSRDFKASRANYINSRVRVLALLFSVLALLWIPIDLMVIADDKFYAILTLRIIFSAMLGVLALRASNTVDLNVARLRLGLFVVIPGLFYVGSRLVFHGDMDADGALLGYSFFPFLMVALLTVVPLSVVEGVLFLSLSIALYLVAALLSQTPFDIHLLGDLWLLALLAMVALWVQISQLHMLMRLYREATRDALTGLVNRRVFIHWLEREKDTALAKKRPLSILLMDLDKFKRVNDDHGHLTGDRVLERFSALLQQNLPKSALPGRYGGEEFIAILPNCGSEEAAKTAERVRAACQGEMVAVVDGEGEIGFSTSIGVTELRPGDSANELLARADNGLYQAKSAGRNTVIVN